MLESARALAGGAPGRMAAWRAHGYGGAEELRLESARVPAVRRPDELLVRVTAASINPIDVAMLDGYGSRILNTLRRLEGTDVEFPLVPGRDFSGRVVSAGRSARLRPGARVWGVLPPHRPGALAQYALVPERWAGRAPAALDALSAGGALYAGLTAASAVRAAGVAGAAGRGARVLLLGLGGVGQAALQLLAHAGAQVVVGCAGEQAEAARAMGAAEVLDRHQPDYEERLETSGPYAAVLDCGGLGGAAAGARRWRFARYVTLSTPLLREVDERGVLPGAAAALGSLAAHSLAALRTAWRSPGAGAGGAWGAGAGAGGAWGAGAPCPPHVRWAYFVPNPADIELLRRLAEQGKFRVQVERVYGWWEAREALRRAAAGHARGKLLLDFRAAP